MTTWMRNLSVLGVAVFLAVASTGCDDDSNHGNNGSTTTTTSSTTTTAGATTTTSTSSTSTTSVTVTTVTSTTTTTIGNVGQCACEVTFGVTNNETLGALQYDTSYAGVGGGFDGTAGAVDCTKLAGDFAAFNDIEAETKLSSAFISAAGFTGPIDVARCRYTRPGTTEPVAADFPITITDQSKPDFSPASATVEVTNVGCLCSGGGTTTTTTGVVTTTTTTGNGTTTTTAGGGGNLYNVAIDLADAVTAGALQFEVDYSAAGGQFTGSGASVSCTSPLSAGGAFVSFNDVDASTQLNFAAVAIAGFTGPTTVANCEFDAPAAPNAGDFTITVVDASAPDLSPIVPFPSVTVSAITPK
jgi:hypothetical protein